MIINDETKANAQATLDYIIMHPEHHNQIQWFDGVVNENGPMCGTTMCVAGTAIWIHYGAEALRNPYNLPVVDSIRGSYSSPASVLLGLENGVEADGIFYNMDNDAAISALTAIANGDEEKFKSFTS